jgi:hypothetical protein
MKNTQKSTWSFIIKVVIAVATALLGAIGGAEAYSTLMQ